MEVFHDIASTVVKLKMYPFFDIAHYIMMCSAVRDDTPQAGTSFFGDICFPIRFVPIVSYYLKTYETG